MCFNNIVDAAGKVLKGKTEVDIEKKIKEWLRHAKERADKENKIQKEKKSNLNEKEAETEKNRKPKENVDEKDKDVGEEFQDD